MHPKNYGDGPTAEADQESDDTSCEACGEEAHYRDSMGVYACESCHHRAVQAYMSVFD